LGDARLVAERPRRVISPRIAQRFNKLTSATERRFRSRRHKPRPLIPWAGQAGGWWWLTADGHPQAAGSNESAGSAPA